MDEGRSGEGAQLTENDDVAPAESEDAGRTPEPERTPEQVRAEIEQTREELGETVEALAAKTDVKGQAKQAVSDAKSSVGDTVTGIRESVSHKAGDVTSSAQQAAPRSVSDAGTQASRLVRENRPAVIALGGLVLGILVGRRRSR